MIELTQEADKIAARAYSLAVEYQIPINWIGQADHIAWKAADANDYDQIIEQVRDQSRSIYEIMLDERRIATAQLIAPIVVRQFGTVDLLEIIEPKEGKNGKSMLEHFESVGSLAAVRYKLHAGNGIFTDEYNEYHSWVSIPLRFGQELKISDKPLNDLLKKQKRSKKAYKI